MTHFKRAINLYNIVKRAPSSQWTIPFSSDGYSSQGAGNHFTSDTTGIGGFGNPNAWCVFNNIIDGQIYQFCIQTDGYVGFRIKYSKVGFTGGTLTQSASASDETVIFGGGTNASPTYQQTLGGRIIFQTKYVHMNFDTSGNRFAFTLNLNPPGPITHLPAPKPLITKNLK